MPKDTDREPDVLVWAVKEGPFGADYNGDPDEDDPDYSLLITSATIPDSQYPDEVFDTTIAFSDFSEAYRFKSFVDSQMEPVEFYFDA
tara:strand:+ start:218 stop:481 length:264 start_codon:yes stop_codon:yes gene_type:complete